MSRLYAQYSDCKQALDYAVANGGAKVELPTPGKATNFAQRCNKLRKGLRDEGLGLEYEPLIIRTDNRNVRITTREAVIIKTLDDQPIETRTSDAAPNLSDEEQALLEGLNLDIAEGDDSAGS